MKTPKDDDRGVRRNLFELAQSFGYTRRDLAKAMGRNHGYFQSVDELILNRILEALELLGVPPREFFDRVFNGPPTEPWLLLRLECVNPAATHPFLDALVPRLAELATLEVVAEPTTPSHRVKIDHLEDLRFRDRVQAQHELEQLMLALLASASSDGRKLPDLKLAEVAAALTGWAAIQRMHGQHDLAGKALTHAFGLAEKSQNAWAEGLCYKRGAFLMREYGRSDIGLRWIDEARDCFERAGEERERRFLLADRALILIDLGRGTKARLALEAALSQLPADSHRYLGSVYTALGGMAQSEGKADQARGCFERALLCYKTPDYACAHTLQRLGHFQLDQGESSQGIATLRRALELLQKHGSSFEVAVLALDVAALMVKSRDPLELKSFAHQLKQWLPRLGRNPVLRKLLNEIVAEIEMERLTDSSIVDARAQLGRRSQTSKAP
jgi:tetratricopeptide (TPR) repeat protein